MSGGTGVNVVPAECTAEVDLRVPTMQLAEEMTHWFLNLEPIGKELKDVPLTGGGSDGNFTAALGIPTLDGLGADGKGAHAAYEQIYYSSLVPRTYLCTRLLETLE